MAQMTVEVVGKQFVRKYYKMCSDEPENLYRFYQNESQLVYGEGSGEVEPVTGIEGIKSKINSRGCKGAEFNIASGTVRHLLKRPSWTKHFRWAPSPPHDCPSTRTAHDPLPLSRRALLGPAFRHARRPAHHEQRRDGDGDGHHHQEGRPGAPVRAELLPSPAGEEP
mmetsp:Transcript_19330/g.50699  ORF Transcript_19330/g.50699 Transcript_19330/m.50699 type:complete len:167 (-) Transcript_19330:212-712(-)